MTAQVPGGQHHQPSPPRGRIPAAMALAVAFLSGAAVMVVELGAARLVAPFFGQSLYVWTNVIATVLAALAAGNFVGGRAADAWPRASVLAGLLFSAAILCVIPPAVVPRIAHALLPPSLELEVAFPFLSMGSLVTAVAAFAPVVFVLGAVLPFLIKLTAVSADRLGSLSGSLYGGSTFGSIAGTFLASYGLIAWFGVRAAFWCAAAMLFACAILAAAASRGWQKRAALAITTLLVCVLAQLLCDEPPDASIKLARDSSYQFVRVRSVPEQHAVKLELNEGLDSFQSLLIEGEVLTGGQYYDYFSLAPLFGCRTRSFDVLILGLAGGTIARQLLSIWGERLALQIDGVEIDPAVVAAGYEFLQMPRDPRLVVHSGIDARSFLQLTRKQYDLIVVDAYAQQAYIPFHLSTIEFFAQVREHLTAGGVVAINVGAYSRNDAVLTAITNTVARVFGKVLSGRIPLGRNYLVWTTFDGRPRHPSQLDAADVPAIIEPLLEQFRTPGRVIAVRHRDCELTLTDDHAPIERLHDRAQRDRARAYVAGSSP
ncbi:MAG: fused MFS/spermidine synthase [Planctomycetota bacterium]